MRRAPDELEKLALREHADAIGTVIETTELMGCIGSTTGVDFIATADTPFKVRVLPTSWEDVCHWVDEWLDPYWDVILEEPHPNVPAEAQSRSLWIFGPSHKSA